MNIKETVICLVVGTLVLTVGTAAVQRTAQWKSATCTANLKTLHQAMFAYANDHDNAIVPVAYEIRPRWTFWHDYIRKYLKDPRVLYCPANPRASPNWPGRWIPCWHPVFRQLQRLAGKHSVQPSWTSN